MAVKHFDCENCGAHGKISFKASSEYASSDIAFCPFCSADIFEEEDFEEDEEE